MASLVCDFSHLCALGGSWIRPNDKLNNLVHIEAQPRPATKTAPKASSKSPPTARRSQGLGSSGGQFRNSCSRRGIGRASVEQARVPVTKRAWSPGPTTGKPPPDSMSFESPRRLRSDLWRPLQACSNQENDRYDDPQGGREQWITAWLLHPHAI